MTVGEKIQFYRKEKNLSQEQLGQMLFVSRQTVSLWEKDQTMPTIDNLLKLKEIFGVPVDELLSTEEPSVLDEPACEQETLVQETPQESFSVTYSEADIRKSTMELNKRRMITMVIWTVVLFILPIPAILTKNKSMETMITIALINGVFLSLATMTVINFFRLKKTIRVGPQQTAGSLYHYDVYENHMMQTISRNGEIMQTCKMYFSKFTNVRQSGSLIIFQYGNQIILLHTEDLLENSRLYWFLRSHANEKKKPQRKGYLTAISVILFILSIASLWFGLALIAVLIGDNTELFPYYLWVFLFFLPIPVGSIVFGAITQRKGYAYKKNIVVGIIMAALLLIYGLFVAQW